MIVGLLGYTDYFPDTMHKEQTSVNRTNPTDRFELSIIKYSRESGVVEFSYDLPGFT